MDELKQFADVGVVGLVLAWVLTRLQPQIEAVRQSVDRLTRSNLIAVLASSAEAGKNDAAVTEALKLLREMETAAPPAPVSPFGVRLGR